MKKAVLGLPFLEKEHEKITLQPNIYRKEIKQHQIENQGLSCHPFQPCQDPTQRDAPGSSSDALLGPDGLSALVC
jgi:hypothetical protein